MINCSHYFFDFHNYKMAIADRPIWVMMWNVHCQLLVKQIRQLSVIFSANQRRKPLLQWDQVLTCTIPRVFHHGSFIVYQSHKAINSTALRDYFHLYQHSQTAEEQLFRWIYQNRRCLRLHWETKLYDTSYLKCENYEKLILTLIWQRALHGIRKVGLFEIFAVPWYSSIPTISSTSDRSPLAFLFLNIFPWSN